MLRPRWLMNQAVHYVDLIQWVMGGAREVFALAESTGTRAFCRADIAAHHARIEVEDVAVAAVRFQDGAIGTIQGSTSTYRGLPARMDLHGEKGNILLVADQISHWDVEGLPQPAVGSEQTTTGAADPRAALRKPTIDAHVDQIGELLAAIDEDRRPRLDGREARKAVELNLAIYRSAREHRPVSLPL